MPSVNISTTSGPLVGAAAHPLLDGHPADRRLGRQLDFGWELLQEDPQDRVHFLVHLMDLTVAKDKQVRLAEYLWDEHSQYKYSVDLHHVTIPVLVSSFVSYPSASLI